LLDFFKVGVHIDLNRLYPKEYEPQILEAVKTLGNVKLKAIKDALPKEISYGAIRFFIYKGKAKKTD